MSGALTALAGRRQLAACDLLSMRGEHLLPHSTATARKPIMPRQHARDEDDKPQTPNAGGSVYEESGYPEENSPRHGTEERDDGAKTILDPDKPTDDDTAPRQQAGARQQDEQQAYRRARVRQEPEIT